MGKIKYAGLSKNYAHPYLNSGKEIILVGIKFNTTKKNIDGVKW